MTSSNRLLIAIGASLAVVALVAALIVLVRGPASFEPGSPEATVQGYILAVLDGDPDQAATYLTSDLRQRCDLDDLDRTWVRDSGRVVLTESETIGDDADVEVEISSNYTDGPFDVSQWSDTERFDLTRVGGEWQISEEPWPFYYCPEVGS